jgi:hypothetical protein
MNTITKCAVIAIFLITLVLLHTVAGLGSISVLIALGTSATAFSILKS